MSDRLSSTGYKRLYALSGNECAFPDCTDPVTVETDGEPVTTSEAAHIVAKSRQGPRGRVEVDDAERRSVLNHVLFCDKHHKIVDAQPRVYSVGVLRMMKEDHERKVARRPPGPPVYDPTVEELRLTALPIVGLPAAVYRADAIDDDFARTRRRLRRCRRSDGQQDHTPFLLRNGQAWAFHNLFRDDGPFANAVIRQSSRREPAEDVWADGDRRRLYVRLLNQALRFHLEDRGLTWDRRHDRYWFQALDGDTRRERVATKAGHDRYREVAYEQRRKNGEGKGVWCHWALQARCVQVSDSGWVLSLRAAYQWTTDGTTPLDPDRVAKKASQKMAHVYNEQYFDQVVFWRNWLTQDTPRLLVPVGETAVVAEAEPLTAEVRWPTIGDKRFDPADVAADDLLSLLAYQEAVEIDPNDLYAEEPDPEPGSEDDTA